MSHHFAEDVQRFAEELHSPYASVLGDVDAGTLDVIDGVIADSEVIAGPEIPTDDEDCSDLVGGPPSSDRASGSSSAQASNRWQAIGLVQKASWRFYSLASDKFVGVLHKVNNNSLKGTCKEHKACVCWISNVTNFEDAEVKLVEWLSKGMTGTKCEHQTLAEGLKLSFGMRVRAKRS